MALLCVACRTENRDAAKFCKGCGGKLVSLPPRSAAEAEALDDAWGATVVASLDDGRAPPPRTGSQPAARASRPSALRSASAEPSSRPHLLDVAPRPRDRSVFWVLLAAAAIVVATGGLYVYRGLHRRPAPVVVQPQAQEPTAVPVAAPAAAPEPAVLPAAITVTPAEALPAEATAPAAPVPMAASPAVAAAASAVPATRKPRKAASASVPPAVAPPVAAAPAASSAPPTAPAEPLPPADPAQACAGRNFIATAQCLVVQCAKPEFGAHARCDAVRKQQRIDEEKRNPTNAA